jgi:hypothetical protein
MANHRLTSALAVLIALFGALRLDAPSAADASRAKASCSIMASGSMPWPPARISGHEKGKLSNYLIGGKRQFDATFNLAGAGLRYCSQTATLPGAVLISLGFLSPNSLHVKLQV